MPGKFHFCRFHCGAIGVQDFQLNKASLRELDSNRVSHLASLDLAMG